VIDLHSHILPGLDDGVATLVASVDLARRAADCGVEAIAATPHVREDYPTSVETMNRVLAEVRVCIEFEGISVNLLPGGEVGLEQLSARAPEELQGFGLGGNPGYLLVEAPYHGLPLDLEDLLFRLRALGITPVLAHPERSRALRDDPELMRRIVDSGTLVQLTASSLAGTQGSGAHETAFALLDAGMAHLVATDAHGPEVGRTGLDSVLPALADEALAEWLTYDVPAAIVSGEPLPPRPRRSLSRLFARHGRRAVA
jgi:protein-tyrosine phosphatase